MIIAVTGATSGIGLAATNLLAQRGDTVIMACRNSKKALEKKNEIAQKLGFDTKTADERILFVPLDLSSIESARNAARELHKLGVEKLYNNGASMFSDWGLSKDGIENNLATNCIGTVALTEALEPCETLQTVVHTVSISCKVARIDQNIFSQEPNFSYTRLSAYSTSKLALFLYVAEKCRKNPKYRIAAIDPGVVNTGMITQERWFDPLADIFFRPFIRKPETAAKIGLRAIDGYEMNKLYRGKKTYDFPAFIQNHELRTWVFDEVVRRVI